MTVYRGMFFFRDSAPQDHVLSVDFTLPATNSLKAPENRPFDTSKGKACLSSNPMKFQVLLLLVSGKVSCTTGMSMVLSKWIITPIKVGCKSHK